MSTNFQNQPRDFPNHGDLDLAIHHAARFVGDPVLKVGIVQPAGATPVAEGGAALSFPGGFAKVYVVKCGAKTFALRCWMHDIGDAAERYAAVSAFIRSQPQPTTFVGVDFVEKGIFARGSWQPILRMEWADGDNLREFITKHLHNPAMLKSAADAFLELVKGLHGAKVAHGDLQSENMKLKLVGQKVRIQLIDYDTLVIPALGAANISSAGLPAYQHPRRAESTHATEKDDYFSELVIYLTLQALANAPDLWERFVSDPKNLIFAKEDFSASAPTEIFRCLHGMHPAVMRLALVLWNFTRCPGIGVILPLEQVVEIVTGQRAAPPRPAALPPAKSKFEEMLRIKMAQTQTAPVPVLVVGGGWLDDSQFSKPSPAPTAAAAQPKGPRSPSGKSKTPAPADVEPDVEPSPARSFQDIIKELIASTPPLPPPAPPPTPPTNNVGTLIFVGILIILIVWLLNR